MAAEDAIQKILTAGYGERIIYSSDFPITHLHSAHPTHDPTEAELCESFADAVE